MVLVAVLFVIARAAWNVYGKEVESRQREEQAKSQLAALQKRQAALKTDIQRLSTEQGIEQEIRDNFRVAKPGERLVVLMNDPKTVDAAVSESYVSGLWKRIRGVFGGE